MYWCFGSTTEFIENIKLTTKSDIWSDYPTHEVQINDKRVFYTGSLSDCEKYYRAVIRLLTKKEVGVLVHQVVINECGVTE